MRSTGMIPKGGANARQQQVDTAREQGKQQEQTQEVQNICDAQTDGEKESSRSDVNSRRRFRSGHRPIAHGSTGVVSVWRAPEN
jgi:hypothetical protein